MHGGTPWGEDNIELSGLVVSRSLSRVGAVGETACCPPPVQVGIFLGIDFHIAADAEGGCPVARKVKTVRFLLYRCLSLAPSEEASLLEKRQSRQIQPLHLDVRLPVSQFEIPSQGDAVFELRRGKVRDGYALDGRGGHRLAYGQCQHGREGQHEKQLGCFQGVTRSCRCSRP